MSNREQRGISRRAGPLALVVLVGCGPQSNPDVLVASTTSASTSLATSDDSSTSSSTTSTVDTTADTSSTGPDLQCNDGDGIGCSTWAQDCPAGQKCTHLARGDVACVDIPADPGGLGDPCELDPESQDTCDRGLVCGIVDDQRICEAFCGCSFETPTCPNACDVCVVGVAPRCRPSCDPLVPGVCGASLECSAVAAGQFVCYDRGLERVLGEACDPLDTNNSCVEGLVCAPYRSCASEVGCCTPYCDLRAPDACAPLGLTCRPITDDDCSAHVGRCED